MKRRSWKRIHQWLGLLLSLIILGYAISGIVLNHRRFFSTVGVSRALLPKDYRYKDWNGGLVRGTVAPTGAEFPELLIYGSSGIWASDSAMREVSSFSDGLPEGADHRHIRAVIQTATGELFAAGQYGLFRYDTKWNPVDVGHTITARLSDMTLKGDTIVVLSRDELFTAVPPYKDWNKVTLPKGSDHTGHITMLKTIWNLHSGAYFGLIGRLLVDVLGVVMIVLSITGILHWWFPKRIRYIRNRQRRVAGTINKFRSNLRVHDYLGRYIVLFLFFLTLSGMFLRPPLLVTIVRSKAHPIPGTSMASDNPWYDQLRMMRYDYANHEWLLYGSNGFYTFKDFDSMPRRVAPAPPVSVMGINVMEQLTPDRWLIGSFSGAFIWDRTTGEVLDFYTQEVQHQRGGMPTFDNQAISGYSSELKALFDNVEGNKSLPPMPRSMVNLPMSLYNVMLEVHTGRIFTFLPFPDGWFAFVNGLLIIVMLVAGWVIRLSKKKSNGDE